MSKDFKIEFGKKLKELRLKKGLTQEQLSFEANVSRSHIGMIEQAKRDISLSAIFRLSRALEVNLVELFEFDDLQKFTYSPDE